MAEPIDFPFGLWTRVRRRKHKFNCIRQTAPTCQSWEDTLPPASKYDWTIRRRRRCALCQITLTTCYLWTRPLRQSHRYPSASSRILYCGHSTQYNHLVLITFPDAPRQCRNITYCSFVHRTSRHSYYDRYRSVTLWYSGLCCDTGIGLHGMLYRVTTKIQWLVINIDMTVVWTCNPAS